jgi:hypothetical protein
MLRDNLSVPYSGVKQSKNSWPFKMGPMGWPETAVINCHSMLRKIPMNADVIHMAAAGVVCRTSVTLMSHTSCQWLSDVGVVTCCHGKLLSCSMLKWSTHLVQIAALRYASNIVCGVGIGTLPTVVYSWLQRQQQTVGCSWGNASGQTFLRQNVCWNVVHSSTVMRTVVTCVFRNRICITGYHLLFVSNIHLKWE